jgi:hypothetical protein
MGMAVASVIMTSMIMTCVIMEVMMMIVSMGHESSAVSAINTLSPPRNKAGLSPALDGAARNQHGGPMTHSKNLCRISIIS